MLQTTNALPRAGRRRKPKWEENPPPQGLSVRVRPRAPIRSRPCLGRGGFFVSAYRRYRMPKSGDSAGVHHASATGLGSVRSLGESMDEIREAAWFHGTNMPRFSSWLVPPPPVPGEELRVPHTAIFFTKDPNDAREVGPNICSVHLTDRANILDATQASRDSESLRQLLIENELARMCLYTRNKEIWTNAWRSGEVLRYASEDPRFLLRIARNAADLASKLKISEKVMLEIAQYNWTRGWIEHIVTSAAKLGFNALHGFEIDRHSGGPHHAVSWLAVTDAKAVTPPSGSPPFSRTLTRRPIQAMRSVHVEATEVQCRVQARCG